MDVKDKRLNNKRLPKWLKMQRASGENYTRVKNLVESKHLHTICKSGNCPNIGECWNAGTATFMILGDICTRSCKFCGTATGKPFPPDKDEPRNLAESIRLLSLKHCVITSVDRDDLPDSGASFWAEVITEVKKVYPGTTIEALIPDFRGVEGDIQKVIDAGTEVISHNLETVERLTPEIRSAARYRRSLDVLRYISSNGVRAKSGIMLGLGEKENEVYQAMDDLVEAGCSVLTIGQYLQPTLKHMEVVEYVDPGQFEKYRMAALEKGLLFVESHPLVRSSYHSERHVKL
ncbi:MAG: lipoyl synthase [Bacteroidales bacterium]|nr:lipoyl synthase [Bacteroidales bacterium]